MGTLEVFVDFAKFTILCNFFVLMVLCPCMKLKYFFLCTAIRKVVMFAVPFLNSALGLLLFLLLLYLSYE